MLAGSQRNLYIRAANFLYRKFAESTNSWTLHMSLIFERCGYAITINGPATRVGTFDMDVGVLKQRLPS